MSSDASTYSFEDVKEVFFQIPEDPVQKLEEEPKTVYASDMMDEVSTLVTEEKPVPHKAEILWAEEKPELPTQQSIPEPTIVSIMPKAEDPIGVVSLDISNLTVTEVVDVTPLEPCLIYVKFQGMDNPMGIPGFFDAENVIFMQFDGSPINNAGFDKAINYFIMKKIERESQEKQDA